MLFIFLISCHFVEIRFYFEIKQDSFVNWSKEQKSLICQSNKKAQSFKRMNTFVYFIGTV